MPYANNKGADQPAHPRSLISAFVVCCLDNISLVSISKISSLCLASVAAQAGLSLPWLQTPKDRFSGGEAYFFSWFLQQWNKVIDGFSNLQFCMQFNKSDTNTTIIDHVESPKLTDVIGKLHEKLQGDNSADTTTPATTSSQPNELV